MATRLDAAAEALRTLAGAMLVVDADLHAWAEGAPSDPSGHVGDDETDELLDLRDRLCIGTRIRLFSPKAFQVPYGAQGWWRDGIGMKSHALATNVSRMRAVLDHPAVAEGGTPDTRGLSPFEVGPVAAGHDAAISTMWECVRRADTMAWEMANTHMPMPPSMRERCIGTPNQPGLTGFEARFLYEPRDFEARDRVARKVDARDGPTGRTGRTVLEDPNPVVMSARFLAPIVGEITGLAVEPAMQDLSSEVAPRPGMATEAGVGTYTAAWDDKDRTGPDRRT